MRIRKGAVAVGILTLAGITLCFGGSPKCDAAGRESRSGKKQPAGVEVLGDPKFKKGLAVSPLWPEIVQQNGGFEKTNTDTIRFGRGDADPVWQMAQWASKYAAYKVTRKGSMTRKPGMGYPELAEVEAFMEAHP